MPFPKRNPESRQTRRLPAVVANTSEVSRIPEFPSDLPNTRVVEWEALWTSPISLVWDPVTDYGIVVRLFRLRFQYELLSMSSDLSASSVQALLAVGREIRLVEGQLGLTPRSRLALGVALFAGKKQQGALDDYMD